jgi:hypothetical protein
MDRDFSLSTMSRLAPPSLIYDWYQEDILKGAKQLKHEAGYSPPSIAEIKNAWRYYLHSPTCLTVSAYLTNFVL